MMRALLMSERGESLNGLFGACSQCEIWRCSQWAGHQGYLTICSKEFWLKEAYSAFSSSWKNSTAIEYPGNIELFFLRLEQLWLVTLGGVEWLFLHCSQSVISSAFLLSQRLKILMKNNMSIIQVQFTPLET